MRTLLTPPDIQSTPMEPVRTALRRKVAGHTARDAGSVTTAIEGLTLYRSTTCTSCSSAAYEPSLVVFLQGKKRVSIGHTTYLCDPSHFLLTSIDLPVISQIVDATPETPLYSLLLRFDIAHIRRILTEDEFTAEPAAMRGPRGMAVGAVTSELLDACSRLVGLLDTPTDIPFLAPLIQREIFYRLLRSPQGQHLRAIATLGDQSQRAAKAVTWLRTNYAKPLRVEELATIAQMGVSTLHHHFRTLTAMSPLQYQKNLRLHVARERMLHDGLDAASAAFEVGYESASQFNREYSRFFGQPPMRDVKALRQTLTATGASIAA